MENKVNQDLLVLSDATENVDPKVPKEGTVCQDPREGKDVLVNADAQDLPENKDNEEKRVI